MMCPYASDVDVGERCAHRACWMWNADARGACVAAHVGNVAVLPVDVQRLHATSAVDVAARVERGRALLQAWLTIARSAAEPHDGCAHCGRVRCDAETCAASTEKLRKFASAVPLDEVVPGIGAPALRAAMTTTHARGTMHVLRALFTSRRPRAVHPGVSGPDDVARSEGSPGDPR